jgi:hypothetical protein
MINLLNSFNAIQEITPLVKLRENYRSYATSSSSICLWQSSLAEPNLYDLVQHEHA